MAPLRPLPWLVAHSWSPQIARLEQTWMTLRQRHTEGAILYEKKLKPFLKSLNEGKGTSPMLRCDLAQVSALSGLADFPRVDNGESSTEFCASSSCASSSCTRSAPGNCRPGWAPGEVDSVGGI